MTDTPNTNTTRAPRVMIVRQTDLYEMPVRRQAEALTNAGYRVEVLVMRKPDRPRRICVNGVTVTSLPASIAKTSKVGYAAGYAWFFALVTVTLASRSIRRRYRVVQINTMPDFLVLAAFVPKLRGTRVVAYMNEPSPELAETLYGSRRMRQFMVRAEQAALRFADHAVTVTSQLRDRYVERGADPARISVVLNGTDRSTRLAGWQPTTSRDGDVFVVVCHGTIEERYGQDTIVEAAALLRKTIPNLRVVFTGRGSFVEEMLALAGRLGVADIVSFEGWVENTRLNDLLHSADLGVVAQKASPYSHLVSTNKMIDYWVHGLPVIASRLDAVSAMFGDDVLEYYQPGDAASLAAAIRHLHDDPARRATLAAAGVGAQERYGWASQRLAYLAVYDALVRGDAQPAPETTPSEQPFAEARS
jgi:glycosyltransferase involved in cell wall biosynthesis